MEGRDSRLHQQAAHQQGEGRGDERVGAAVERAADGGEVERPRAEPQHRRDREHQQGAGEVADQEVAARERRVLLGLVGRQREGGGAHGLGEDQEAEEVGCEDEAAGAREEEEHQGGVSRPGILQVRNRARERGRGQHPREHDQHGAGGVDDQSEGSEVVRGDRFVAGRGDQRESGERHGNRDHRRQS